MMRIRKNPYRNACFSFHIWERLRHTLTQFKFDSYRPEQHYMRGPGPKYRAKRSKP
jgi:hypothetical protein